MTTRRFRTVAIAAIGAAHPAMAVSDPVDLEAGVPKLFRK